MDGGMKYASEATPDKADKADKADDYKAMHRKAMERHTEALDADRENRLHAADDLAFIVGEQWPEAVKSARELEGRPVITINRLPQFLRQVTGDIRRTNPALSIIAGDSEASEDTAEIYDGLVRQIQYSCDAPSIYELSAEQAAACGMGWFRVLTEYEGDETFDQVVTLKSIINPFAVHCDPQSKDPTRRDAKYMFVVEQMTPEAFKVAYPDASTTEFPQDDVSATLVHWYTSETIGVAEYWYKEPVRRTIARIDDGSIVEVPKGTKPGGMVDGMVALYVREVDTHRVMSCKLSGFEVLEEPTEWPGRDIPIIAVMGEEIQVGERTVRSSVIRYAKDPQRLYNYARSQQAEVVSLQPKVPFIGTTEQFAGLESQWALANTTSKPYLPYNPDPDAPGPPQRSMPPVSSSGLANEIAMAADDMQATTGIYDAALGQRSNEKSGIAIERRQMESDISTSIYVDNLSKAIGQAGRIMVDLIPVIYDAQRMIRITGKDEVEKNVEVNGMQMQEGFATPVNDLTLGRYDVRVKTGPSYTTARSAAADAMIAFVQAVPQAAAMAGDLIAKTQDWPGADELAERLKKMLPPGMADEGEPTPEMMQQQQMAQQQQQVEQQRQREFQQMELQIAQADLQEKSAKAKKAEADAEKAYFDAQKARFEASAAMREEQLSSGAATAAMRDGIADGVQQIINPFQRG